jgi:hypothetical protein
MNSDPAGEFGLPRVRVPLIWACGVLLALSASLFAARYFLQDRGPSSPDWRDVERVEALDRLAGRLRDLLDEIEPAPARDSAGDRARWESWVENNYRPRVAEFRRRLLVQPQDSAAYAALLRAADRLGGAAANPGNRRALEMARSDVDDALLMVRDESARLRG